MLEGAFVILLAVGIMAIGCVAATKWLSFQLESIRND